jgi:hypothetical protein
MLPAATPARPRRAGRKPAAWTGKWDGRWTYAPGRDGFQGDETIEVFSVRPAKVFAFAKGNFSTTRHKF